MVQQSVSEDTFAKENLYGYLLNSYLHDLDSKKWVLAQPKSGSTHSSNNQDKIETPLPQQLQDTGEAMVTW